MNKEITTGHVGWSPNYKEGIPLNYFPKKLVVMTRASTKRQFTDEQVAEWMERNLWEQSQQAARTAMEDAASI